MKCQRCGKELGDSSRCQFCGYDNAESVVREMSPQEKNFYRGITIEANPQNSRRSNGYSYRAAGSSSFIVKFLNALLSGSILARIAVVLICVAVSAVFFFIALPIFFFVVVVGVVGYIFFRR